MTLMKVEVEVEVEGGGSGWGKRELCKRHRNIRKGDERRNEIEKDLKNPKKS